MTKLSHYAQTISEMTGTTDPGTLGLIEQLMRDENGGVLDHLTTADFAAAIPEAIAGAAELKALGLLAGYCDAMCIPVPDFMAA